MVTVPEASMIRPIRRALLSVSDKTSLVEFAGMLHKEYGVELIATGGTKKALAEAGLPVRDVSELTGFPEILDGRVKTLHPAIYAGLLARRDQPSHMQVLAENGLPEIDLVVCNLYPFEATIAKPGATQDEAIETIDIGGPCMIRAAAKNYHAVAVAVDPADYPLVLDDLRHHRGATILSTRQRLAAKAFARIADYDAAIARYFALHMQPLPLTQPPAPTPENDSTPAAFPDHFQPAFRLRQTLRYGENPHQAAAFYVDMASSAHSSIANAQQLHGKELSYNNILDLDSALNIVREFDEPAAVIVKHNNPCGAAIAPTLPLAFQLAWQGDSVSAFGGILAFNRPIDDDTAQALASDDRFVECVIAPDFTPAALQKLQGWKKHLRLLRTGPLDGAPQGWDLRRVDGGLLVQTRDTSQQAPAGWKQVSQRPPSPLEQRALAFAWVVCKHVKSNAIVLARCEEGDVSTTLPPACWIVGVGAGQMSRIDSTRIAIQKAGAQAVGSVLASDAFFPFRDNVDAAAEAGVTAIVQPGGSLRDAESIQAVNEHGLAMLFTGRRHFRH